MPQCNHGAHSIILGMRALDMQAAGLAIDSVSRGTEFAYNTVSQSLARSPVLIAAISDNLFGPAVPKPSHVPTASLRQVLLRVLFVRLGPAVSTESAAAHTCTCAELRFPSDLAGQLACADAVARQLNAKYAGRWMVRNPPASPHRCLYNVAYLRECARRDGCLSALRSA
jgi:hypothetical protein